MSTLTTRTRSSRGAVPQAPDAITGLGFWLSSDTLSLNDGDAVATWTDASTNAWHATQATGANQPVYKTNIFGTQPAVRFAGSPQHMRADAAAALFSGNDLPCTVLLVATVTAVALQCFLSSGLASSAVPFVDFHMSAAGLWEASHRDDANASNNASGGLGSTSPHLVSWVYAGTTLGIWDNGGLARAPSGSWNVGQTTTDRVGIGARVRNTTDLYLTGDLGMIGVWNRALLTGERRALELWAGAKYGIAVT